MAVTRIAIATADGVSVCDHLARAAAFVVVEVNSGVAGARTTRARGTEACGNHAGFVEMLAGCEAVICGGIGQGAAVSLAAHGIRSLVSPSAAGSSGRRRFAGMDGGTAGHVGRTRLSVQPLNYGRGRCAVASKFCGGRERPLRERN